MLYYILWPVLCIKIPNLYMMSFTFCVATRVQHVMPTKWSWNAIFFFACGDAVIAEIILDFSFFHFIFK